MESADDIRKLNNLQEGISPEAWSTNSDSPTPANSSTERPWVKDILWQGLLGDEHRQLLGTEEESSDRHSSDDDADNDIESLYRINSEQLEYYKKQFNIIQPDYTGLVSGHIAKIFFEKSGIPIEDLRHIWQLCDVTKDGALSLAEFSAAMHLVVLRRNNIPLPSILPLCLNISTLVVHEETGVDNCQTLLHLNKTTHDPTDEIKSNELVHSIGSINVELNLSSQFEESGSPRAEETTKIQSDLNSPLLEEPRKISGKQLVKDWKNTNRHWTKFSESPISNLSSPGLKPVNFDMQRTAQAVVSDPQILHPVPLRVTPVETGNVHSNTTVQNDNTTCTNQLSISRDLLDGNEMCSIQRPISKKATSKATGLVPQTPHRDVVALSETVKTTSCKLEQPPLPPPRPYRHARSSSLDLNKLVMNKADKSGMLNPINNDLNVTTYDIRESPILGFADFTQFGIAKTESQENVHQHSANLKKFSASHIQPTTRISAFEVYRKPLTQCPEADVCKSITTGCKVDIGPRCNLLENGKGANEILRNLKQHNTLLLHLCKNLSDELVLIQQHKEELLCSINL